MKADELAEDDPLACHLVSTYTQVSLVVTMLFPLVSTGLGLCGGQRCCSLRV